MKVVWTEFAAKEVQKTSRYIFRKFGQKAKQEFLQEIKHIGTLLERMPNLGKAELYLENMPVAYRSFVIAHLNKVVYYIENDSIIISDFWNMRRDPEKLAGRLK